MAISPPRPGVHSVDALGRDCHERSGITSAAASIVKSSCFWGPDVISIVSSWRPATTGFLTGNIGSRAGLQDCGPRGAATATPNIKVERLVNVSERSALFFLYNTFAEANILYVTELQLYAKDQPTSLSRQCSRVASVQGGRRTKLSRSSLPFLITARPMSCQSRSKPRHTSHRGKGRRVPRQQQA